MIEDQLIYYTSSDSCGNDTDGFDLCVLYFPDGSIFTNSSVHFCGAEGTSSYLRNLYKDKIVEFKSSLIEAGFKNWKLDALNKLSKQVLSLPLNKKFLVNLKIDTTICWIMTITYWAGLVSR